MGCKERFDPKIPSSQSNYLVVEGVINAQGVTTIKLSRTVPLKDSSRIKPETNALVTITGEDNSTYNVRASGNGTYTSDALGLNSNQKYRLHIKTSSGGEYLSDYVAVRQTPAIDSINWKVENGGVQIYINTHDPKNNTRYYKWDYEETWEIHSAYGNYYEYKEPVVVPRNTDEIAKLFYCWQSEKSTKILTGSSVQLSNDVINLAPITVVPLPSEKLSVRYSILIKQYSLDREAYQFYQMMKSNTEALGSVFDPMPSEITGNIKCVSNRLEKVVGYITASTVDQQRIFISRSEVPSRYQDDCVSVFVPLDSFPYYFGTVGVLPYQAAGTPGPITGYYSSYPPCIDCTLRGTNVKPSFW